MLKICVFMLQIGYRSLYKKQTRDAETSPFLDLNRIVSKTYYLAQGYLGNGAENIAAVSSAAAVIAPAVCAA